MQEYRVIVQLNDAAEEDYYAAAQRKSLMLQNKYNKSVKTVFELLDKSNLLLRTTETCNKDSTMKTQRVQQFCFDYIGFTSKQSTHRNIETIIDKLLLEQQSCSLIRFSILRECQIQFLIDLLVSAVDKRLNNYSLTLKSIHLECYLDVHRFNVFNLLNTAEQKADMQNMPPKTDFYSTMDLLNWLETEYFRLWRLGTEHECLDFCFTVRDAQKRTINLKLSIVNFYLSLMNTDSKVNLCNFLKNYKNKVKHTMITDCIREYFTSKNPTWSIYMLFDVPIVTNGDLIVKDMFKIASAAYFGMHDLKKNSLQEVINKISNKLLCDRMSGDGFLNEIGKPKEHAAECLNENEFCTKINEKCEAEENILEYFDESEFSENITDLVEENAEEAVAENNENTENNLENHTENKLKKRTVHFENETITSTTEYVNEQNKQNLEETLAIVKDNLLAYIKANVKMKIVGKNKKDMHSLKNKIDEVFKAVLTAMQNYYTYRYTEQITKVCQEIEDLVHEKRVELVTNERHKRRIHKDMQKCSTVYHKALIAVQDIEVRVKNSNYATALETYVDAKKSQLTECSLQFKQIQLSQCMSSIKGTIGAELSLLHSAIQSNNNFSKHYEY